jgi:hypothetical protein
VGVCDAASLVAWLRPRALARGFDEVAALSTSQVVLGGGPSLPPIVLLVTDGALGAFDGAFLNLRPLSPEHDAAVAALFSSEGDLAVEAPAPAPAEEPLVLEPWAPPQLLAFEAFVFRQVLSTAHLAAHLAAAARAVGFENAVRVTAEQLAFIGHAEAPTLVCVVEDLQLATRIRAYDGSRPRLLPLDEGWLPLVRELLAVVGECVPAPEAEELVARGRRQVELGREAARQEARMLQRVEADHAEALVLESDRRRAPHLDRMLVKRNLDDQGFPSMSVPGNVVPKAQLVAAFKRLREGVTVRSSRRTGDGAWLEVRLGAFVVLFTFEHLEEDERFHVHLDWPRVSAPHTWRTQDDFPLEETAGFEEAIVDVYAALTPDDVF